MTARIWKYPLYSSDIHQELLTSQSSCNTLKLLDLNTGILFRIQAGEEKETG